MNSLPHFETKYKILKYKNICHVNIQLNNGNGIVIVYHKDKKNSKMRKLLLIDNLSIRNYIELMRILKVNIIIKSKKHIRLHDMHSIIFRVSQILNKEFLKSHNVEEAKLNYKKQQDKKLKLQTKSNSSNFIFKLFLVS